MVGQGAALPIALLAALALGAPMGVYGLMHMGADGVAGYSVSGAGDCCMAAPTTGHGMAAGRYGAEGGCPHHGYAGGRGMPGGPQLVVLTGTIVEKDADRRLIVVSTDDGIMTIKLLKVYVDEGTGYLVSGDWLAEHMEEGDTVTVGVHGGIAYSLEWNGRSYAAP